MPSITKQVELDAPKDKVWATLTDFSRYPDWNTVHVGFPNGAPELAPDATYKEKVKIMGMPGEVTWNIEEVRDGEALTLDGKGPMGTKMRYAYKLSENNGGTLLDLESEFGGAALGAMVGALTKETEKQLDESLAKFKGLV